MNEDFNELKDLSANEPEKLKELKALFDRLAVDYELYPFIDMFDARRRRDDLQKESKER
jgi:hypothetical protein